MLLGHEGIAKLGHNGHVAGAHRLVLLGQRRHKLIIGILQVELAKVIEHLQRNAIDELVTGQQRWNNQSNLININLELVFFFNLRLRLDSIGV